MNKKAMYQLTYGLFVLTSRIGVKDHGCIINTAGQVTSSPNRISIAVNKDNLTHDVIMASRKFNLSILSEKADFEILRITRSADAVKTDCFTLRKERMPTSVQAWNRPLIWAAILCLLQL